MTLINVSEFTFETDTNDSNGQPITVTGNVSVAGGVGIFNDTEGAAYLSQTITADTDIGDNADFVMTLSGFRLSSAGLLPLVSFGDMGAGTGVLVMVQGENGYFQILRYNSAVPVESDLWETSGFLSAHTYVLTRTNKVYSLMSDGVPCTKRLGTLDGVTLPSFVGQQYILGGFEAAGVITYFGNVKIEADRIPATVTLTYNGNGNTSGTAPSDATEYEVGATVTALGIADMLCTNKMFAGWNTAADGTGTWYAIGSAFVITADTTLYAIWRGISTRTGSVVFINPDYKIRYDWTNREELYVYIKVTLNTTTSVTIRFTTVNSSLGADEYFACRRQGDSLLYDEYVITASGNYRIPFPIGEAEKTEYAYLTLDPVAGDAAVELNFMEK